MYPGDPRFNHSYTLCAKSPGKGSNSGSVWHVESFLGFEQAPSPPKDEPETNETVDVLVIDDGNAGFRNLFASGNWPKSVPRPAKDG
jgi:hypothetical protein